MRLGRNRFDKEVDITRCNYCKAAEGNFALILETVLERVLKSSVEDIVGHG